MIGPLVRTLPALFLPLAIASLSFAQAPKLEKDLNAELYKDTFTETGRSAKVLFDAYLELSDPPMEVGDFFNLTTIWPGMDDWDKVSNWAAANEQMGEALMSAEKRVIIGMPYGASEVSPQWRDAGIMIEVAPGGDLSIIEYPYLYGAVDTIACWATAEFYRLLEAGEYDKAFELSLAYLRVLRQGCEQVMLEEKTWFMDTLSIALSIQRDAMYTYLDKIPPGLFQKLGTKEFPFLKATDDQRMRRLQMPEGDRILAEAMVDATFDSAGQADYEKFSDIYGALQARDEPLTRFGAKRRWLRLAGVHASRDATEEKLTDVYDDWWRRWRMRQFDPMMDLSTEFSRLNKVRFAAIVLAVRDLDKAFRAREKLVANINGTILSAGLCYQKAAFGAWPSSLAPVYAVAAVKRFDFDPYHKGYGQLVYKRLGSPRSINTEYFGQLKMDGCMLYALGEDHFDDGGTDSTTDGTSGDLLLWPPVRQMARNQGELD